MHRFAILCLALVAGLMPFSPASAQSCSQSMPRGVVTLCVGADCTPFQMDNLQSAFDYITTPTNRTKVAYLELSPGWYVNPLNHDSSKSFLQIDWRQCETATSPDDFWDTARAGFLLKGRQAVTFIEGTGNNPEDVKIWARVPNQVLLDTDEIFHGIALVDNTQYVEIRNVAMVSDGGYRENGAGDATVYAKDTNVTLRDTFVLANKKNSNPLRGHVLHDQEGIVADGGHVVVRESAVGGNIHTGVMVLNGGHANLGLTVVQGNGWDGGHFQNAKTGHGVTSFYDPIVTSNCLDGNTKIDVQDSMVRNNTGSGVLVRGAFNNQTNKVAFNELTGNKMYGFTVNGGWNGGETTFNQYSRLYVYYNQILNNTAGSLLLEDYSADSTSIINTSPNNSGPIYWHNTLDALYTRLVNFHNGAFGNNAQRACYP